MMTRAVIKVCPERLALLAGLTHTDSNVTLARATLAVTSQSPCGPERCHRLPDHCDTRMG
jgi:hypothetical protein